MPLCLRSADATYALQRHGSKNRRSLGHSGRCTPQPREPWLWSRETCATAQAALTPLPRLQTAKTPQQVPSIPNVLCRVPGAAPWGVQHAHRHAHYQAADLVAAGVRRCVACRGRPRVRHWRGLFGLQRLLRVPATAHIMRCGGRPGGAAGILCLRDLQVRLLREAHSAASEQARMANDRAKKHTSRDTQQGTMTCLLSQPTELADFRPKNLTTML